ncbi:MAG: Zn-ribbon domain-containing OB-fold protein [Acidimicrobiia bacterium]
MIPPKPTPDDAFFWEGAAAGKLLVRACASCGRIQHPPSPMCPVCHSTAWTERDLSGRGTVHSWIASHHPGRPDEEPRVVILVELDEGIRMVSNLVGVALDEVRNEMPVQVCFVDTDGFTMPQFERAEVTA